MKQRLSFFGLSEDPFVMSPNVDYFFPSPSHNEALKLLNFFLESGDGFALLTGIPGIGKTTVIRKFLSELPEDWETSIIVSPMLGPNELIKAILTDIGIEAEGSDPAKNLSLLQSHLLDLAKEQKKLLLIIDEAQSLSIEALEQIRLLSNIETKNQKPLQIILSGQSELEKMVKEQIRQLNQRITVRARLRPLDKNQTISYAEFKMVKAGGALEMKRGAKSALYKKSKGIPRLINGIMKIALTIAYSNGRRVIKRSDILDASSAIGIENKSLIKILIFVIFLIMILIIFTVLILHGRRYAPFL